MIGSHTHDVIAAAIDSVHKEFGIASKVNCTITDNGSNFLKAFKVFSCSSSTAPNEAENSQDFDFQDVDEDEDFVYLDIGDIFEKYSKECEAQEATASDSSDEETIAAMHTKRIKLPGLLISVAESVPIVSPLAIISIGSVSAVLLKKGYR